MSYYNTYPNNVYTPNLVSAASNTLQVSGNLNVLNSVTSPLLKGQNIVTNANQGGGLSFKQATAANQPGTFSVVNNNSNDITTINNDGSIRGVTSINGAGNNLTVNANEIVNGTVNVNGSNHVTGDVTLGNHLVATDTSTLVVTHIPTSGTHYTCSVVDGSNDVRGTIVVKSVDNFSFNDKIQLTFTRPYESTPFCVLDDDMLVGTGGFGICLYSNSCTNTTLTVTIQVAFTFDETNDIHFNYIVMG